MAQDFNEMVEAFSAFVADAIRFENGDTAAGVRAKNTSLWLTAGLREWRKYRKEMMTELLQH